MPEQPVENDVDHLVSLENESVGIPRTVEEMSEDSMGDPPSDLTEFQIECLVAVGRDTVSPEDYLPHGIRIKRLMSANRDREVRHGRLYPNLDELVEKGLIEKGEKDQRTNWYRLTADGAEVLADMLLWAGQAIDPRMPLEVEGSDE